ARIQWCISERSIGVVTGEVGAGKTVSVRTVLSSLDPSKHTVIYLPNPQIGIRGIHEEIVNAFGQTPSHLGSRLISQTGKALLAAFASAKSLVDETAARAAVSEVVD